MEPQKPPYQQLGEAFIKMYYETFDANRANVIRMYHPSAMVMFEDHVGQGHDAITEIFTEKLRFASIQHLITKVDCQPILPAQDGVIVLVTGKLKTDDDPPHAFSQLFTIRQDGEGYFLFNDVFRLSIHDL